MDNGKSVRFDYLLKKGIHFSWKTKEISPNLIISLASILKIRLFRSFKSNV